MLWRSLALFLIQFAIGSCIDRLDFDTDKVDQGILVVDGLITDKPGPYTVRLFRSSNVDDVLNLNRPFNASKVVVTDDVGNMEELVSEGNGIYRTKPNGIQGIPGRKYKLYIEGSDGVNYESTEEEMLAVGVIDSVYFQWESTKPLTGPTEYGFRVFMNSRSTEDGSYLLWKFTGTHEVQTFPEFRLINDACQGPVDPEPCSGVVATRTFSLGFVSTFLETVSDCQCCRCWANDTENKPRLNDKLITDGTFKNVEMGFVPFDQWTFRFGRYMVKIEQMSLSQKAFEFWKIVRDQKEGATSLFQPSFGKVKTNINSNNANKQVTGLFYAAAVTQNVIFINASDARIPVPPPDINPPDNCFLWKACDRVFPDASRTPPLDWE